MRRTPAESLALRAEASRKQARMLPDPETWLQRIEEIEQLAATGGSTAARRLVELMTLYVDREMEYHFKDLVYVRQTGRAMPPEQIYGQLAGLAHCALRILGPESSEALVQAYSASGMSKQDRWRILLTLKQIGDPRVEPFLRAVEERERLAREARERHEADCRAAEASERESDQEPG